MSVAQNMLNREEKSCIKKKQKKKNSTLYIGYTNVQHSNGENTYRESSMSKLDNDAKNRLWQIYTWHPGGVDHTHTFGFSSFSVVELRPLQR